MTGQVDVADLRAAHERSGLSVCDLAYRVGRDEAQLRRILRNAPYYKYRSGRRYGPYYQHSVMVGLAAELYRGMGFDPFEVGL